MTVTQTRTSTKTYTRMALIKEQVRRILRRTTDMSAEAIAKIEKGIDQKYIKKFIVYALNKENLCRGELIFEIDWDEYEIQISRGRTSITIDKRWVDDTAIEVDEVVILFNQFVSTQELTTKSAWYYSAEIAGNADEKKRIMAELGHTNFEGVKWSKDKYGVTHQIPELPEVKVGCYLIDE